MRNFSESPALSIRLFQKAQREVIYSPVYLEKMRSRCILTKNCSLKGENRDIYGPYNFWAPVKNNTSGVWHWNCWTFLVQKLKCGEGGGWGRRTWSPWPSQWPPTCNDFMNKVKNTDIPNDVLLVTADIVGLYPSILHEVSLKALRNALENIKIMKKYQPKTFLKWQKLY